MYIAKCKVFCLYGLSECVLWALCWFLWNFLNILCDFLVIKLSGFCLLMFFHRSNGLCSLVVNVVWMLGFWFEFREISLLGFLDMKQSTVETLYLMFKYPKMYFTFNFIVGLELWTKHNFGDGGLIYKRSLTIEWNVQICKGKSCLLALHYGLG